MTSPIERHWWRGGNWALMLGSLGFAVAAAAALALGAEDTRLLRLGIVAALWAALLGTFAAERMRREIGSSADRVEELRAVYQRELEREIAARREHELTVERELRERFGDRQQADIVALRTELESLRGTLQHLLGGDVLVERVALRESTRLRPLTDRPRPGPDTEAVSRAPRSFTVSEWPLHESSVSDARAAESLLPDRRIPLPPEQPAEGGVRERRQDSLNTVLDTWSGTDRSWSPAVSWTPSAVSSTVPSAGTGQGRRRAAEPDPPVGNGRAASPKPESTAGSRTQAQSVGAHRGGRSVQDLLAAYGENPTPRHRRRRDEDSQ